MTDRQTTGRERTESIPGKLQSTNGASRELSGEAGVINTRRAEKYKRSPKRVVRWEPRSQYQDVCAVQEEQAEDRQGTGSGKYSVVQQIARNLESNRQPVASRLPVFIVGSEGHVTWPASHDRQTNQSSTE